MSRRRPTLLDDVIEDIDRRIGFLQQERAHVLRIQAAHHTRPTPEAPTPKARRAPLDDVTARNVPRLEPREQ